MNYNFWYTRFRARKTVLGARPCVWEIVLVNKQACTLLIMTWYGGRNCTKLVLKTASLFQPCVLLLSCRSYYFSLHDDYPPFLYTMRSIYIAALVFLITWNEKRCSEPSTLTMDHKLNMENFSLVADNTAEYHYLFEGQKYLNIKLKQIY